MQYSNNELLKLWSNSQKRRKFAKKYKEWDQFAVTPDLNLTFFKYDLPDGSRLVVMEHMAKNYYPRDSEEKWFCQTKVYLQKEEYFIPNPMGEHEIDDYLKGLKQKLLQDKGGVTDA